MSPKTLLAGTGPPGSACMRIWTATDADPASMRPNRLACVTARTDDEFRGGVYEVTGAQLPKRIADASVKQTASGQSIVLRFTQSSIGRPQRIRFAVEATRPGCERVTCIDTLPDGGAARTFRLRYPDQTLAAHAAHGERAEDRDEPGHRDERRPRQPPRHAADEALAHALEHVRHRVDVGDRAEPVRQQVARRRRRS